MSRSFDREPEELQRKTEHEEGTSVLEGLSRSGGAEARPRADLYTEEPKGFGSNRRERIVVKNREYRVRPSESAVLHDLGTFRLIRERDLVKGVHGGDDRLAQSDLRSLKQQGLIRTITFSNLDKDGAPGRVHMLSGKGHELLEARSEAASKAWYFGAVKRTEVHHDSLLYRAYLRERSRIEDGGGTIKRVVLDTQLKRDHFSRTNKPGASYRKVQAESAQELQLPVIDGHVVFPDFRLEYEDERGEVSRADIEVATDDYRGKHIAMKAAAGFRVYAASPGGGVQVQHGHNLKAHVWSRENHTVLSL
jgi:hypothetical protein